MEEKRENEENKETIEENIENIENEVNTKTKNKSEKGTKIAIGIVIILIICVIIELFTEFFSNSFSKIKYNYMKSKGLVSVEGNTIGNIRNHGYVVSDEEYLYYMSPNKISSKIGIRRIRKDNLKGVPEVLIEDIWEITGLNYLDGYIYFVTFKLEASEDDEYNIDNKIHKMKVDGSEHTIINDNEFNDICYEIYAIEDKVYYIGEDEGIYYMDLDGNNKTKLNNDNCGFVGITKDYIFYNVPKNREDKEEQTNNIDFTTYMMNRDGTNAHPVVEDTKMFCINVVNDYIYYVDQNRYLFKVNIDGTDRKMISQTTAYNLIVTEDGIYYNNYYNIDENNQGIGLYRMDLNGENITQLAKIDTYSESLGEFDNWLFYTDNNENEGRFMLVSKDGTQIITLYRLDFSQFVTINEDTADMVFPINQENTNENDTSENN